MARFYIILLAACGALSAQTVSNVTFDGIGDSSARVIWDTSSTFTEARIRYIASSSTSDCNAGTGGTVQTNGTSSSTFRLFGATENISGLAPSTSYCVAPEVRNGGGAWSTGAAAIVTTVARNSTPVEPTAVDVDFPTPTGSTLTVASNCSDLQAKMDAAVPGDTVVIPAAALASAACTGQYTTKTNPDAKTFTPSNVRTSDSQITITSHGFTDNQEIRLSSGDANGGYLPGMQIFPYGLNTDKGGGWRKGGTYYINLVDANNIQIIDAPNGNPVTPGYIAFTCNAGTDQITFAPDWRSPDGFSAAGGSANIPANTIVQFKSAGTLCAGLSADTDYYLLTACAASGNTACVTQVSLSSGGAAVDITGAGTGTHTIVDRGLGTMYIIGAPDPNAQWITITTSGTLPPEKTQITPDWAAQLATLRQDTINTYNAFKFKTGILARNWRLRGLAFTTDTNSDYLTVMDPRPYCGMLATTQDSANIIFDQVYVHGPGYPNRFGCNSAIYVDGQNVGFLNSWMDGMDYWHPWYEGCTVTTSGATNAQLPSGCKFYSGASIFGTKTLGSDAVIAFTGGSATGTCYVYYSMSGVFTILCPTGTTGTCTVTGVTCSFTTSASPDFPTATVGGVSRSAAGKLATITLTAGAVTAVSNADAFSSLDASEGSQAIIAGNGPGPYILDNNHIEGTGIPVHFDDSGGPFLTRGDYTVSHNWWETPATQLANGPSSNTLRYGHRQPVEWKGGQRVKANGNIFRGQFQDGTSASVSIAFTPRSQGYITDVQVTNNSFLNVGGGTNLCGAIDSYSPVSKPCARQKYSNNLFLPNGYTQRVVSIAGTCSPQPCNPNGNGWAYYGGYGAEDIEISNSTYYAPLGYIPAFMYWSQHPLGGFSATNNVISRSGGADSGDGYVYRGENVANCPYNSWALAECAFTAGPGNTSYTFSGNVGVPSYNTTYSASTGSGSVSESTACTEMNGTWTGSACSPLGTRGYTQFITGADTAARLSTLAYTDMASAWPDASVSSGPLSGACGGADCGFKQATAWNAQGIVRGISVTPSSTTASVTYTAPDTRACWVGRSTTNDQTTATWTTDGGGSTSRTVSLSGLSSSTLYYRWVRCYADQPSTLGFSGAQLTAGSFTTTSGGGSGNSRFIGVIKNGAIK